MRQTSDFTNLLASMEGEENTSGQPEPPNEYDVYVEPEEGRITFIKKTPGEVTIIDDKPPIGKGASSYISLVLSMLLLFSSLFIPSSASTAAEPIVTITIYPKIQKITTTQNVQLPARLLPPLTLSESMIIPTTGKG